MKSRPSRIKKVGKYKAMRRPLTTLRCRYNTSAFEASAETTSRENMEGRKAHDERNERKRIMMGARASAHMARPVRNKEGEEGRQK